MNLIYILLLVHGIVVAQSKYELEVNEGLLLVSHEIAMSQIGQTETHGANDSPQIRKYLAAVGINSPASYCAAGQYWAFVEAHEYMQYNHTVKIPLPKTGVANKFYAHAQKHGKKAKYSAKKHDLIVWRRKNSWQGHVERVDSVGRAGWVWTVGFNTSPGRNALTPTLSHRAREISERNGDGVWYRKRNIKHPLGRLVVRGLVGFDVK